MDRDDPFDLHRYVSAQEPVYDRALAEIKGGRKRSHWMWYIFPQIQGLGHSTTTRFYAIKSQEEARCYLAHPVLGPRLMECAEAVLANKERSVSEIFGYPDDLKLKSSMTLFASVTESSSVFERVLTAHYDRNRDVRTLELMDV